jgi:Rieske Fe-S protein
VPPKRFEDPLPRRDFLGIAAMCSVVVTMSTALIGVLRLPKPAALPESASRFKIGFPDEFPPETHRKIEDRNVWIFRDALGFYAFSAICTHLGCVVTENDRADGFTCPCHGSLFDSGGRVLGGPAPRGLDWLELSLAVDGSLMVDSGKTVNPGSRFNV